MLEKYAENYCTIIVSTHLIVIRFDRAAIIIRDGRILKDCPTDELTSDVYTVSGPAGLVDKHIEGKHVLSSSNFGGLKIACVQGQHTAGGIGAYCQFAGLFH